MAEMNVYSLFIHASLVVKCVMLILLIFSVVSWAIIIQRTFYLKTLKYSSDKFEDKFWSGAELTLLYQESQGRKNVIKGIEKIFHSGFKEFTRLYQQGKKASDIAIEGANRAMRIMYNREVEAAENRLPFLGIVGSVSPYIGLFGTVWGIMNSFIALEGAKQATLQMVAPGIAEALIATAMGLFAAIPAVIAYNRLSLRVSKLEQSYDNFIEEFVAILYRQAFSPENNEANS